MMKSPRPFLHTSLIRGIAPVAAMLCLGAPALGQTSGEDRSGAAAQAPASPAAQPAVVGPRIDPQRVFLDKYRRQPGVMVSGSGLHYRVLKRTTQLDSPRPGPFDTVRVNYEGRLIDGTLFDGTAQRGAPAEMALPKLIRGWQEGIPMMQIGDVWEFVIPAMLGYGPVGRGPVPGGATLVFKVELVGFTAGQEVKDEGRFVSPETEKRKAQEEAKKKKGS